MKVSLKTIATEVGVSTALVSYVLNGKQENRIGKDIAARIREVADRHNYRPNQIARSLKTQKTATIGLIVADILNPFSAELTHIVSDEASRRGYSVIFGSANENADEFARLTEVFMGRQVDGLILLAPEGAEKTLRNLSSRQVPFVLLDRYFESLTCNSITLDNVQAGRQAASALLLKGARRIGLIGYDTTLIHLREREIGYRDACQEAGLQVPQNFIQQVGAGRESTEVPAALHTLLRLSPAPDALIFTSSFITIAALKELSRLSDSVTGQLQLVGFDETEIYDFYQPGISYIRQPIEEFGRRSVQMLIGTMIPDASNGSEVADCRQVLLNAELRTK